MNRNAICHICGRTMDASFIYCPWCGTVSEELVSLALQMDDVFSRIGVVCNKKTDSRIAQMDDTLGELEQELSFLLSEAQPS